jgi:hypothetical protein
LLVAQPTMAETARSASGAIQQFRIEVDVFIQCLSIRRMSVTGVKTPNYLGFSARLKPCPDTNR